MTARTKSRIPKTKPIAGDGANSLPPARPSVAAEAPLVPAGEEAAGEERLLMLVLRRYVGEQILIGESIVVTLAEVNYRQRTAKLAVTGGLVDSLWIPEGGAFLVAEEVTIDVFRVKTKCAKLGTSAPRELQIRRGVSPERARVAKSLADLLRRRR